MAFTNDQTHELKAKLSSKHVKTRKANGDTLHYVEGWHVIAEANRIFGHEGWDRETIKTSCVWSGNSGEWYQATYLAKVRVMVRAGDIVVVREGSGAGEGRAFTPGQAHEFALKGAETDATKRALATFGNPFGLALYDREQAGVRKTRKGKTTELVSGPWILKGIGGSNSSFEKTESFADALRSALSASKSVESLFAIWEQNIDTVRAISKSTDLRSKGKETLAHDLVKHFKSCVISFSKKGNGINRANGVAPLGVPGKVSI